MWDISVVKKHQIDQIDVLRNWRVKILSFKGRSCLIRSAPSKSTKILIQPMHFSREKSVAEQYQSVRAVVWLSFITWKPQGMFVNCSGQTRQLLVPSLVIYIRVLGFSLPNEPEFSVLNKLFSLSSISLYPLYLYICPIVC